jgi:hypothetical protein
MTDYIDVKAKEENCSMIVSRCFYREILLRIVFYYNQGYGPKGFYLCKNSLMKKGYLKFLRMGYIKQIVVLILDAARGLSFVPLNRIIIRIFQ